MTNVNVDSPKTTRSYNSSEFRKLRFTGSSKQEILSHMGLNADTLREEEVLQLYNRITNFMSIPCYINDETLRSEFQQMVLNVVGTIVGGEIRTLKNESDNPTTFQFVAPNSDVEPTMAEKKAALEVKLNMPEGAFRPLGKEAVDTMYTQNFSTEQVHLTFKTESGDPNEWGLAASLGMTEEEWQAEESTEEEVA